MLSRRASEILHRGVETFWERDAMEAARANLPLLGPRRRAALERADASFSLASKSLPWEDVATPATWSVALALYREAASNALVALRDSDRPTKPENLLHGVPESALLRALGDLASIDAASAILHAPSEPTEHTPEVWRSMVQANRRVASALLREARAPRRRVRELWARRVLRALGAGVLLAAIVVLATPLRGRVLRHDIAAGRPWRASSGTGASHGVVPGVAAADFFQHTEEEASPWLEIDLGEGARFSGLAIDNRKTCCGVRVVPLVVEASADRRSWAAIARRDDVFESWTAWFPSRKERYLRLRVDRKSILHLARVRVFAS